MTDNPLVSVKMLTYNHVPYIAQAIEGVLSQKTDFPFELVIGEDCSTDGTREIVFRYAEAHPDVIRVVTSESNVGMKANGRRTTQACRGKYLAWCEGDDYWHRDDKLQLQISFLEGNADFGLVYSDYDLYNVTSGTRIVAFHRRRGLIPPTDPTLTDLLFGRCGILTCTVCARLEMLRSIAESDPVYSSRKFLMGDTPRWAEILMRSRVHYFADALATHNILPESAAHSQSPVRQQRFYASNKEMRVYLAKKYKLPQEVIRLLEAEEFDSKLFLAFLEAVATTGRAAWQGLAQGSFRQRLLYWGSQSGVLNRILKVAWTAKRRAREQW